MNEVSRVILCECYIFEFTSIHQTDKNQPASYTAFLISIAYQTSDNRRLYLARLCPDRNCDSLLGSQPNRNIDFMQFVKSHTKSNYIDIIVRSHCN